MTMTRRPARVISPGQVITKELEARGWTQRDLAAIMGRPYQAINEIINGTKQITPDTSRELAKAFGTSIEFWMNLEANFRLFLAAEEHKEKEIERRSRIYSIAPVSEMVKRNWIQGSDNTDELESEVCAFLEIETPFETPKVFAQYRISENRSPSDTSKATWVKRVEQLARLQHVKDYQPDHLRENIPQILALTLNAEQTSKLPPTLQDLGVHFIIVPHLPYSFLDGAALYIEERPVIAVTLRYDRIDWFWFTVLHELAHIVSGHPAQLDSLFVENEMEEAGINYYIGRQKAAEREANEMARNWLLDPVAFSQFIAVTQPYFSKSKIEAFSAEQKRHPGIVLGQLQYRKVVEYNHLRSMLEKVRPYLKEWIDSPIKAAAGPSAG
jgi:HTH-type transcriptional regulator / antitoxin HigA